MRPGFICSNMRIRRFLLPAVAMFLGLITSSGLSSCTSENLSDSEVIQRFVEYAEKEGRDKGISVMGDSDDSLTLAKITNSAKVDNQIVVLGYNESAMETFRKALLEEFFDSKDNSLMTALINKEKSLEIILSGKVLSVSVVFTPDELAEYKRYKR